MVPLVRNWAASAVLHAMGRLMSKGVPDLDRGLLRSTHHKGVDAWVIKVLEPSLRAVFLNHAHTSLRELFVKHQCLPSTPLAPEWQQGMAGKTLEANTTNIEASVGSNALNNMRLFQALTKSQKNHHPRERWL